ncbi:MAG TPA: efflux RND transporter periplasmic adaptor subunit [Candidatus Polarisedimenticolia bacterium]|nr:efflux RND transporter periplasmic adaptor subunit [Candidatus Polarisedimenticolia bacterium]
MKASVPSPRRRRRPLLWVGLPLLLIVGVIAAVLIKQVGARTNRGIASDDLDIRLGKSAIADVQVAVNEVGTIEPVKKVDVKSTLSGKVTDLLMREGDRVVRGQVLARVEPDVNQAQTLSDVRSSANLAELAAADARRNYDMNQRLHEEGLLSEQGLKDFKLRFDTAIEDLEAAKAKMRIVVESGVPIDKPISTTQRVNIVSPMDGFVIRRQVEVGQTVMSGLSSFNEGTVIYTVADVGDMLIKASINEVDIGRVKLGSPVVITVDAFPYRRFDGTVSHISPAAHLKDKIKVFDTEVTLPAQVAEFRAGMTANIEIRGERADKALSVPVEAIFKKDGKEVIYVLKATFDEAKSGEKAPRKTKSEKYDVSEVWGRFFEERAVKVGLVSLERAQILDGLKDGLEVALENPTRPRQVDDES